MKRYPRTLKDAFPNTMEYGASITKFYRKRTPIEIAMTIVSIVGFAVILLDLFIWRT
jgi:hypothetical protein